MILPGYYEFNCPVKITSGHKALDEIPEILSALGCSKPVIITDQGVQSAGLIDILYSVTDGKTDFVSVMDDVPPDSDVEIVSRYADMYRESGADSIIALGGGSVLDTAKGVNILVSENAITNGVELILNSEVTGIVKSDDIFTVSSGNSHYKSKVVINSSGIFSDRISELAGAEEFHILPAKGQYLVFDQTQGYLARTVLFQVPGKRGKGILVTPTCYGNLMIGPNSEDTENREDLSTDSENLDHIFNIACKSIPDINLKKKLKTFSGLRAKSDKNDS